MIESQWRSTQRSLGTLDTALNAAAAECFAECFHACSAIKFIGVLTPTCPRRLDSIAEVV